MRFLVYSLSVLLGTVRAAGQAGADLCFEHRKVEAKSL